MMGTIGILNVGAGDTKLSFDPDNPIECARSARIVADMLKRGYVLFIKVGEKYQRVKQFDEAVCEYVIADLGDPPAAEPQPAVAAPAYDPEEDPYANVHHTVEEVAAATAAEPATEETTRPRRRGRPSTKRVKAGSTHGVAVHRSAGG